MHAEVSVGYMEQFLEFVERQRIIYRQSADNSEPGAFVNQAVKVHRSGFHGLDVYSIAARFYPLAARVQLLT